MRLPCGCQPWCICGTVLPFRLPAGGRMLYDEVQFPEELKIVTKRRKWTGILCQMTYAPEYQIGCQCACKGDRRRGTWCNGFRPPCESVYDGEKMRESLRRARQHQHACAWNCVIGWVSTGAHTWQLRPDELQCERTPCRTDSRMRESMDGWHQKRYAKTAPEQWGFEHRWRYRTKVT